MHERNRRTGAIERAKEVIAEKLIDVPPNSVIAPSPTEIAAIVGCSVTLFYHGGSYEDKVVEASGLKVFRSSGIVLSPDMPSEELSPSLLARRLEVGKLPTEELERLIGRGVAVLASRADG